MSGNKRMTSSPTPKALATIECRLRLPSCGYLKRARLNKLIASAQVSRRTKSGIAAGMTSESWPYRRCKIGRTYAGADRGCIELVVGVSERQQDLGCKSDAEAAQLC